MIKRKRGNVADDFTTETEDALLIYGRASITVSPLYKNISSDEHGFPGLDRRTLPTQGLHLYC